jgi:plastocyanin
MKQIFTLCALLIALALSATFNAAALTVSGGLFQTDVSPGDQIKHKITVSIGDDENSTDVTAGVFGYGLTPTGGRDILTAEEDTNPYSARDFLSISPENATINPGEPVTFVLEGSVPEDVGSGARYALAYVTTLPRGSGQVGIALAAKVPVILTISGTELRETGEITDLTVSEDNVSTIFKNTGNYHYKASAEAILKNNEGIVIANATAPLSFTSIIPTASWLFDMPFENATNLDHGTYTVEVSVIHKNGTVLDTDETILDV